jgi:hypothetical protein
MLPPGKYVVEVVVPPGFELVKEEDKNILIGDNFIAPVTQEFGGLGNIFIIPDQASVAASQQYPGPGYNANNAQNPTQSFGTVPSENIVPGFIPEPTWPCVGEARIVPDYISLYPQSKEVAPFAGATRNLCDRKEVTLGDQMGAIAKFYIYTSTHIASKFTGGITDDYTSEFDPFSPQFGEKFAPPNLPVSVKDWAGNEISRVYADQWGSYDGMTYSTWEVNPPNPTGYSPTMMVFCMNDPGPIPGPVGTMITDPAYTYGYSQFCYELPFMPGTTQYLDTPVVPTSAFAGAGYNNVDCSYPDATPAIAEVDGDQVGPWVSKAGNTLTITALGDQVVPNYAYSGPSATTAPYNQKTITRHYGFGAQGTGSSVTIGGVNAPITGSGWSDTSITVTVPSGVPNCAVQQQAQYVPAGTTLTQCGQLVITAANGKQSIDTVTVTIGGNAPTHVAASGSIQAAIDKAAPGDLIIVDPTCNTATTAGVACSTAGVTGKTAAAHNELLQMWKPVRLQGVGATSSIINANTHPAGKLDPWRQRINCLFGLNLAGTPVNGGAFDPSGGTSCPATGWNYFVETPDNAQVDPIPAEAIIGWDATANGNLAQLLQEPSLMGALEGAGITVVAKGANFPAGSGGASAVGGEGAFPTGTTLLTGPVTPAGAYTTGDANALCHTSSTVDTNPFPSNFQCNPSSIDGLAITDSSQGGGGIFVHAWAHNLQIANNRIYSNGGTLSGGINLGQGEFAPQYVAGSGTNLAPGSCVLDSAVATGAQLPYCENMGVNIHNNNISLNSSTGDELFSATPAGAGGVSICTGSDYYKFNYNWVCGNLSSGDGGGLGHLGMSYNGDIEHNSILFNQSLNPTIPANGGGLVVMGTPDVDAPCGATTDQDCVSAPGSIGPSDGIGPNLVINANLIMGNAAEAGTGGGIAFQNINGADVLAFPTRPSTAPLVGGWWAPTVTNNIIANNVAGWDGGGVSFEDALNLNFVNNTVIHNNTTASAGILFDTIGAPLASQHGTNCRASGTTSCPQPAGLVSIQNSAVLQANFPTNITCPPGHYAGATANNGTCRNHSYPVLADDVFWQNSSYYIGVGALSNQFQQNVISLYNAFTTSQVTSQHETGECVSQNTHYWDIGVRGDTSPTNHGSGVTLNPQFSLLTAINGYGNNNIAVDPQAISPYCNGSRVPPESCGTGGCGYNVPPGIADATVPNPIFNLTPVATVDEGNNWINLRWGPLSLTPITGVPLGNYALASTSPAIDQISLNSIPGYVAVPRTDFFGNPRPDTGAGGSDNRIDIGAVEYQHDQTGYTTPTLTSITPNQGLRGTTFGVTLTGTNLNGVTAVTITPAVGITITGVTVGATQITATFTITTTAPVGPRIVAVTNPVGTSNGVPFIVVAPTLTSIAPTSGTRGTTVHVILTGTNLASASSVTVSGTGVTCTITGTPTATTVNASCVITATATTSARTVSVVTPSGTTNGVTFTVLGPTLTAISPTSGTRGATVPVTLTGTNLTGATAVSVSGTGVTCTITGTTTATTVNASCVITLGATVSTRNVTATTPIGVTPVNAAVTFTVIGPTVASVSPTSATRSTAPVVVTLTFAGSNLSTVNGINGLGSGVTLVAGSIVPSATSVTLQVSIAPTATVGTRNVSLTTSNIGNSNSVSFAVN